MSNFLNEKRINVIQKNLGLNLTTEQVLAFNTWEEEFIKYNSHTNLMSKNEVPNLFEKHLYDSLSMVLWSGFAKHISGKKLMDIGTGGGFPSIILAIAFPNLTIFANDSRVKKTKFLEIIKEKLNLHNLNILYGRAEEISPVNADIVTFRAVGKIKDILPLAKRHTAQSGKMIFYKAKDVKTEINETLAVDKNLKAPDIIPYSLPMDVETTRNLIIFNL